LKAEITGAVESTEVLTAVMENLNFFFPANGTGCTAHPAI
jgi:hypothetical protein